MPKLSLSGDARALVMVPQRDGVTIRLLAAFQEAMGKANNPLVCLEEGRLAGQDDWEEDEETPPVECWWGIFKRNT